MMENLIESVKKHRALWDLSTKIYKDQTKRLEAWIVVAEECSLTPESAKAKWRGLRDTYIKFLKSQKRTTDHGRKKRRRYCYAEQMAFMKPFLINIKTRKRKTEDVPSTKGEEPKVDVVPVPHPIVEYKIQDAVECPSNERLRQLPCAFQWTNRNVDTDIDAVDMLFLSYSKTMKTFSKRRQILLKRKIADLFADVELEQVKEEESDFLSSCTTFTSTTDVAENISSSGPLSETNGCKIEFL